MAIAEQLRRPSEDRTWEGTVVGFVPYDFRMPTIERARSRWWNPDEPRLFVPQVFGVGWTINFARLVRLGREPNRHQRGVEPIRLSLVDRQDEDEVRFAERWVAAHTPVVGGLELMQTEPWASVFRAIGPNGEIIWFKVCAPHQAFEVPFTAFLSARWPTTVTQVLAHDAERRWLLMADAGEPLRTLGNPPERWLDMLPAYAQLQIGETEQAAEHRDAGVPDLRLELLPARYDELLAVGLPLAPNETAALRGVSSALRRTVRRARQSRYPPHSPTRRSPYEQRLREG